MAELSKKLGDMEYDGLISDTVPQIAIQGGTICKETDAAATYVRGTVFAKSAKDGKLYLLGSTAAEGDTLTADCILCEDTEVGTDADVVAAVYLMGCFDPDKLTVKSGYTMTTADKDALREKGILLKAASAAL